MTECLNLFVSLMMRMNDSDMPAPSASCHRPLNALIDNLRVVVRRTHLFL